MRNRDRDSRRAEREVGITGVSYDVVITLPTRMHSSDEPLAALRATIKRDTACLRAASALSRFFFMAQMKEREREREREREVAGRPVPRLLLRDRESVVCSFVFCISMSGFAQTSNQRKSFGTLACDKRESFYLAAGESPSRSCETVEIREIRQI